jgi:hypothetical protein
MLLYNYLATGERYKAVFLFPGDTSSVEQKNNMEASLYIKQQWVWQSIENNSEASKDKSKTTGMLVVYIKQQGVW